MIEIIDITKATITHLNSGRDIQLFNKPKEVNYMSIGLEINGFSKYITLEGESFQRVLDVIKEEISNL